jgi:hypothetical protein
LVCILFNNRAAKGEAEGIVYSLEDTRYYFIKVVSICLWLSIRYNIREDGQITAAGWGAAAR